MKNAYDQHVIVARLLVVDDMRPMWKLSLACPDLVTGLSHQRVPGQFTEDLTPLFR